MKKTTLSSALLAVGALAGCGHVLSSQSITLDSKTTLFAHLEGADLKAKIMPSKENGSMLREVLSDDGKVLFAYDMELSKRDPDGAYLLRLKPSKQTPTFSAVREVTVKPKKEAVRVELMENPSTGQKVSDVLSLGSADTAPHELMSPMSHIMKFHNMVFHYFHGQ